MVGLLPYDELFDDVVDSHEVGMRKPNPAIYRLALERLGATADRTAFLDDIASNVAAAQTEGLWACSWKTEARRQSPASELAGLG